MLKRSITGFFILLAVAGFAALRLVSPYFFDAFVLAVIYLAVTEVVVGQKFYKNIPATICVYLYPLALMFVYIFGGSLSTILLLQLALLLVEFVLLVSNELIRNAIERTKNKDQGLEIDAAANHEKLFFETQRGLQILVYPTSLLGFLFGINHMGLNLGFVAIILIFAITMATDVFAFLFGKMIGGPKFAPEISPHKTLSGSLFGALGGLICAAVGYVLFVHLGFLGNCFAHNGLAVNIIVFILVGLLGTFLTQFGDLVESAFKRRLGIKDFGHILPGHGGVMDRVDGLMFTAALVYIVFGLLVI